MKTSIDSSLGLKLSAIVEVPEGDRISPLVILIHGNTGWKEEAHLKTIASDLVSIGIATIRFDAPGSGESEGTWADDYRATNYIEVVKDVYDWAVENLEVNRDKVGLWGHSMGGMVAVQVAARWPELFAALCGSQPSTGKTPRAGSWKKNGGFTIQSSNFGDVWLPAAFLEDRLQYNTAKTVKQLTIPQLYIAGTKDTLVSVREVQEIYKNANGSKQYEEFETDHFYKNDKTVLRKINQATVSFFQQYLL